LIGHHGGRSFRPPPVSARHGGAAARPGSVAGVRNSIGPVNQWPAEQLIMALSSGSSVDLMMNRHRTSAGNPQGAFLI
jgi:hypothetical protein